MRLLIIGGSGFIGRHFVRHALAAGHECAIVSRGERPSDVPDNVDWLTGGLAALPENLAALSGADVVCHFASSAIPASSNADPVADIENNLIGTVRLLEAMKDSPAKRLVYLSSGGAVYGPPHFSPITEDHPKQPVSSYGIVKNAAEMYLGLHQSLNGLRPAIIRPSNPYGPGQQSVGQLGAINTFMAMAASGDPVNIFGDGSIVRDFVFIDDLCRMLMAVIEQNAVGTFNCGSGQGTSLANLLDRIEGVTGRQIKRIHQPARGFDPPEILLDISRAREALSWSPNVSLDEGLRRTWQDFDPS